MNSEKQRHPHARSPVQLTMEEIKVLKDCRVNSIYYRGLPLGLITVAVGRGAIQSGKFPGLKRWSGLFYTGMFGIGFLSGVASYREECTKKILALENSVLADQYRSFLKGKGFNVDESSEFDTNTNDRSSYETNQMNELPRLNTERSDNVQQDIEPTSKWDEIRQQSRQPSAEPSRGISYEDLRKRNRASYNNVADRKKSEENNQNDRHFVDYENYTSQSFSDENKTTSGLDFSDKSIPTLTFDNERAKESKQEFVKKKSFHEATRRKNAYGDEME